MTQHEACLGRSDEQESLRREQTRECRNCTVLRRSIEVDEEVSTEDYVVARLFRRGSRFEDIALPELHLCANSVRKTMANVGVLEIAFAKCEIRSPKRVLAINGGARRG